jgi:hypothetical protein
MDFKQPSTINARVSVRRRTTECPGHIVPEEHNCSVTVLRCNECGDVVGQVESWPLHDLASLALTGGMDTFIPDPEHINALPEPVRRYIHDLAIRG